MIARSQTPDPILASTFFVTNKEGRERGRGRERGGTRRRKMSSWNSFYLELTYQLLGWIAFVSWSFSFYPQVILNFKRKSVVGLNFDFLVLNLTKHSSYLIYNAALFFSPEIQKQYHEKYGYDELIPVAANDVAFSIHAVLLTGFTLCQVLIYDRGNQKVSKICILISSAAWASALVCLIVAWPTHSWLWLVSMFKYAFGFQRIVCSYTSIRSRAGI